MVTKKRYYARKDVIEGQVRWQDLRQHLMRVAEGTGARLAPIFADKELAQQAEEIGGCGGLLHDIGKTVEAFIQNLRSGKHGTDHSSQGAAVAVERYGEWMLGVKPQQGLPIIPGTGLILATVITGRHRGLRNMDNSTDEPLEGRQLRRSVLSAVEIGRSKLKNIDLDVISDLLPATLPKIVPNFLFAAENISVVKTALAGGDAERAAYNEACLTYEMFTRFFAGALVGADIACVRQFNNRPVILPDNHRFLRPSALLGLHNAWMTALIRKAPRTVTNRLRREVLRACRLAAAGPRGIYTLDGPTGSGKTHGFMSFSLNQCINHGMRRVIVAVPYITVTEQIADVYREALHAPSVVEHHSNVVRGKETSFNMQASEEWAATVVVTTQVQLFESLLANRGNKLRKLPNIANSVIVLDEIQALPPKKLATIMDVLQRLVTTYQCTVVLSTATQPDLTERWCLAEGITNAISIIKDPRDLFRRKRQVQVEWDHWGMTSLGVTWDDLASRAKRHKQVIVRVWTRNAAIQLYNRLPKEGRYHLSASMCSAHRLKVLKKIKAALAAGETVRLVTTGLIEAGVDIDFPVGYCCLAGLDNLAQIIGRIDREGAWRDGNGRRRNRGLLRIFRIRPNQPDHAPPPGVPTIGTRIVDSWLHQRNWELDLYDIDLYKEYFRQLYDQIALDGTLDVDNIQDDRIFSRFESVARKFQMIPNEGQVPVLVPYEEGKEIIQELRALDKDSKIPASLFLRMQRYIVTIYPQDLYQMAEEQKLLAPAKMRKQFPVQQKLQDDAATDEATSDEWLPDVYCLVEDTEGAEEYFYNEAVGLITPSRAAILRQD